MIYKFDFSTISLNLYLLLLENLDHCYILSLTNGMLWKSGVRGCLEAMYLIQESKQFILFHYMLSLLCLIKRAFTFRYLHAKSEADYRDLQREEELILYMIYGKYFHLLLWHSRGLCYLFIFFSAEF